MITKPPQPPRMVAIIPSRTLRRSLRTCRRFIPPRGTSRVKKIVFERVTGVTRCHVTLRVAGAASHYPSGRSRVASSSFFSQRKQSLLPLDQPMAAPRLNADPNLQICPDFGADEFALYRNALALLPSTLPPIRLQKTWQRPGPSKIPPRKPPGHYSCNPTRQRSRGRRCCRRHPGPG